MRVFERYVGEVALQLTKHLPPAPGTDGDAPWTKIHIQTQNQIFFGRRRNDPAEKIERQPWLSASDPFGQKDPHERPG